MKVIKKNVNIVSRFVPPANFLVDITKCYNNRDENLLEIDEMGTAIWECFDHDMTREDVLEKFMSLLNDEKTSDFVSMVENDLNSFIDLLIKEKCLIEVEI